MNDYKITKQEEYYNVQIITNGYYCGNGKYCKSLKEAEDYLKNSWNITIRPEDLEEGKK